MRSPVWLTKVGLVALTPGTVFFETKPGPYVAPAPPDRAPWAAGEGEPGAGAAEAALRALFRPDGA